MGKTAKKVTEQAPKKKKYKSSRAGRAEEAADNIRSAAQAFRDVADQVEVHSEQLAEEGDTITLAADIFKDLTVDMSDLKSPLEELQEEMQNWYDNLPESLQGGDKGDRIQEAANQMEAAVSALDEVDMPDIPAGDKEMTGDELDELVTSLQAVADQMDTAADEAEGAEFPGMYG